MTETHPDHDPEYLAAYLQTLPDDVIKSPLWTWHPREIPAVQHERRRRGFGDAEPVGDPAYH